MKKQLLVLLCLAVLSIGTAEARRGRYGRACAGGSCAPCAPCGDVCPDQCDVQVTCPQGTCINPPGAPCFESCVRKECTIEQVPVQFYRNVKRCNVEVPGPVYATCPGTDRMVAPAPVEIEMPKAKMMEPSRRSRVTRRQVRRANAKQPVVTHQEQEDVE